MAQNSMSMVKLFGRNIKAAAEGEYKTPPPSEEKKKRSCYLKEGKEEENDDGGGSNSNSREIKTVIKKPDRKLPCPRCNSVNTKFCYFNNYNINQPRHFCRNCQRYWTAGGSMRKVPVGAGRRKNKSSITTGVPVGDMGPCKMNQEDEPPSIYTCNNPPTFWIPTPWMASQFPSMQDKKVKTDDSSSRTTTSASAWLTIGTNSKGDGFFKDFFNPKDQLSPDAMHTNPAALSRSLSLETT